MSFLPSITLGSNTYAGLKNPGLYGATAAPIDQPVTVQIVPNSSPKKAYFSWSRRWETPGPVVNGLKTANYVSEVKIVYTSNDPAMAPATVAGVIAEQAAFLTAANVGRIIRNEN